MICVAAASSLGFTSSAYFRPPLVLVGPTFSWLLIPPLRITKKGYLSVTFFYYWSGQWDWRCRCVLARFHFVGVLSSASRPCRPHFFVAPHPATPNNKKRLPFGNLLLLLERAMGLALPLCPRSAFRLTGVLPSASRPCRPHFFVAPHPVTPNNKKRATFR